jgi:glyoxylase-like metal-dependent hydrolase (beta-lactamase superfamily II)
MGEVKLHAFSCGSFVTDKGTLNNKDWGVPYEHPIPMYLFEHRKGMVLFDTGMNHRGLSNGREWWGDIYRGETVKVTEADCMPAQLKKIGINPKDIRYVIMSHLHIDHAGEMESFPQATFVVRNSELRFAWWPDRHMKDIYAFSDLKNTRKFDYLELEDGFDFDVFADESLVCVHTPGHTPGHQSLIVRASGYDASIVLAADACYTMENLDFQPASSGLMWNVEAWCRSIRKLQHFREIGYDVWLGHDSDDWRRHTSGKEQLRSGAV